MTRSSFLGRAPKYMEWYGAFGITVTLTRLQSKVHNPPSRNLRQSAPPREPKKLLLVIRQHPKLQASPGTQILPKRRHGLPFPLRKGVLQQLRGGLHVRMPTIGHLVNAKCHKTILAKPFSRKPRFLS